jgi:hypothetical protein
MSIVRNLAGAVALAALLGACSAGPTYFYKEGQTDESFNKDKYECLKENQVPYSESTVTFGRYYSGGGSSSGVRTDMGMAKVCMEGRGYHKMDPKTRPPAAVATKSSETN